MCSQVFIAIGVRTIGIKSLLHLGTNTVKNNREKKIAYGKQRSGKC